MCLYVPNFLSYVSAKYYLNWFTAGKVIAKIKRVNFLLRHRHVGQLGPLSQANRAAACISFGKNINAKRVHLTLLYPTALTSTK